MNDKANACTVPPDRWVDPLIAVFFRVAASGWIPASWFGPGVPPKAARAAKTGVLHLEIVSHCWNYAHLLAYQLSSLVKFPPRQTVVTMTVYYSPEDVATRSLLDYFGAMQVPGVCWSWRERPKEALFRRAIGRNEAALGTSADWIWFTDCDLMFREDCLDRLADALQGCQHALVFPQVEYCTTLLADDNPVLRGGVGESRIVDIDPALFAPQKRSRATGPLQITHGDVARGAGYCNSLAFYQRPARTWRKAHEDRAFRWLLGTQGVPVDVPGVYRIRHVSKGRYTGNPLVSAIRSRIRRIASRLKG